MKLPVRLLFPQPPEVLIFKLGHTVTVVLSYLQFKFPYPGTCSLGGFYSRASAARSSYPLYLLVSNLGASGLCCDPSSLLDLRKIDFICSDFPLVMITGMIILRSLHPGLESFSFFFFNVVWLSRAL